MMNTKRLFWLLTLLLVAALAVAACRSSSQSSVVEAAAEEHADEADHDEEEGDSHAPEQHMAGAHDVPEEAAVVPNPVAANDTSIAAGAKLFATTCAVCHGESGHGDGPGAAGLEKPPADLTASHVQELSDGALFYIVSHGKPDTPMPAWEKILNEEERWQVVNFLRTLE